MCPPGSQLAIKTTINLFYLYFIMLFVLGWYGYVRLYCVYALWYVWMRLLLEMVPLKKPCFKSNKTAGWICSLG